MMLQCITLVPLRTDRDRDRDRVMVAAILSHAETLLLHQPNKYRSGMVLLQSIRQRCRFCKSSG